jgi:hypothetical protein
MTGIGAVSHVSEPQRLSTVLRRSATAWRRSEMRSTGADRSGLDLQRLCGEKFSTAKALPRRDMQSPERE